MTFLHALGKGLVTQRNVTESGIEIPRLEDIVFLPSISNTFEFRIEEKDRLKVEVSNLFKDKVIIPYFSDEFHDYEWIGHGSDQSLYILQGIENTEDGFRIDFGPLTNPSYRTCFDYIGLGRRTKFAFLKSLKPEKNGGHRINGLYLTGLVNYPTREELDVNPWGCPIDNHIYIPVEKPNRSSYILNLNLFKKQ